MSHWSVYIVRCADKSLYTGITIDAATRVLIHNAGKGAKYTRSRRPVKLVYKKAMRSESAARKLEARIKTLSRAEKLDLVRGRSLDAWHKT
jgi:putative endonuclease